MCGGFFTVQKFKTIGLTYKDGFTQTSPAIAKYFYLDNLQYLEVKPTLSQTEFFLFKDRIFDLLPNIIIFTAKLQDTTHI